MTDDYASTHTAALADLGQKVINAIVASDRLGHGQLRHSVPYYHAIDEPSVDLVKAVLQGDTDDALAAYEIWCDAIAERVRRTA